ncbi:hypothetical protein BH11MYX1_BH11MYX1_07520 [soil metagenome]
MKLSALATVVAACGSGGGGGDGLPTAFYRIEPFALAADIGEVFAFNATGHIVSHSTAHGGTVTDIATRVFTQLTAMTGFLGFDDAGELLFMSENGGPTRFFLRSGNGGGGEIEIPLVLAGGTTFAPFALGNDGSVWGVTLQPHDGAAATPHDRRYPDAGVNDLERI